MIVRILGEGQLDVPDAALDTLNELDTALQGAVDANDESGFETALGNLLDTLCATLEAKMQYEQGERDMVMLQHKFEIEKKDGSKETRTSTLLDFGAPVGSGEGPSSMAKLVGVPCGIAVQLVLDGVISKRGILAPYTTDIVDPLIEAVEKEGITMVEKVV